MKENIISEITREMLPYLDNAQMEQLQNVLHHCLWNVTVTVADENAEPTEKETNLELLELFLSTKRVEQVQQLLGHAKIDTTMQYAVVDQNNVNMSHKKYIA